MGTAPSPHSVRPLRLLQVLGYAGGAGQRFGITGVERVVEVLVQGLAPQRFTQFVAYPQVGELFDRYAAHATVLDLEPQRRFDRAYVDALAAAIHEHAIDVVLSHGLRFDFLSALASRGTGVPHVVVRAVALADETMGRGRKLAFGVVDGWTLRRCSGIVAVSEASKRRMLATQRLRPESITVIPNGVRLPEITREEALRARRTLGIEDDRLIVGGVGQLIPRKAFDRLVAALSTLRARHPRIVAVLLGEGPERSTLEAQARTAGIELLLPGFQPNPYPALAGFDIAVLPSLAEGMPLVVLEAMALGVATVATSAAGTVEVIEEGLSGRIVPPDDVPALAAALDALLTDGQVRARLAAAGRDRVHEHFTLDAMLRRFESYLQGVVACRPSGRHARSAP